MSEEEILRKLKKAKEEKEKAYTTIKGMIQGIRLGKLSPIEGGFLSVIEVMFDGFKNIWDDIFTGFELQLQSIQRISNLEAKMKELEDNILQLRQTLDRMIRDR